MIGKLVKNLKVKRVTAILLLICTVMTTFITSSADTTYAASNNLRATYLDLMAGKDITSVESAESLTTEDLRCIALFLSNFYVPFGTSLDGDSEDDNKEVMNQVLVGLGFEKNAASSIVDAVYEASLNSATPIYVKMSDAIQTCYDKSVTKAWTMTDESTTSKNNTTLYYYYWEGDGGNDGDTPFIDDRVVTGTVGDRPSIKCENKYQSYVGEYIKKDGNIYTPVTLWIWDICYKYYTGGTGDLGTEDTSFYTYSEDTGTFTEVFKWDKLTHAMYLSMLSTKNGILNGASDKGFLGNAFINFPLGRDDFDYSEAEVGALCALFQNIYVDWVGNILCDFGEERVVIYPACANNKVFSEVDDTGVRLNLLSTHGFKFINTFCSYSNKEYTNTKKLQGEIPFVRTLGSTKVPTWDTKTGWGGGGDAGAAGDLRDMLRDKFGILTNHGTGEWNDWDNHSLYSSVDSKAITINSSNTLGNCLIYKTVESSALDTGSSVFIPLNLLDKDFTGKYFANSTKFENIDGNFDYITPYNSADYQILANMFVTYAFAYANKDYTTYDEKINYVDMKFNDIFPEYIGTINWTSTSRQEETLDFIYYLLHPVEGVKYVATLLKSKINGFFLDIHEDMVGGTTSNSTTGMTRYLGFTGYATSPSLNDIEFIAKLLDGYNSLIVFLIIFMSVILLCYVLTGSLSLQRGIVGLLIFALFAFIPPVAINATVNVVNTTCDSIYSSKFDYWAICQMEEYLGDLSSTVSTTNKTDYIMQMLDLSSGGVSDNTSGFSGAKVKWMTPKKINELAETEDELSNSILGDNFSSTFIGILSNTLASTSTTEEFAGSGSLYLYRDLLDIFRYSALTYNLDDYVPSTITNEAYKGSIVTYSFVSNTNNNVSKIKYTSGSAFEGFVISNVPSSTNEYNQLESSIKDTSSLHAIYRGFLYSDSYYTNVEDLIENGNKSGINYYSKYRAAGYLLHYSNIVSDIHSKYEALSKIVEGVETLNITYKKAGKGDILYGVESPKFNLNLNQFQTDIQKYNSLKADTLQQELSGMYYALYTESPFYYFNYNTRDCFVEMDGSSYDFDYENLTGNKANFYKLFLNDNQGYFFNLKENAGDGYGELRDFMNFHDLFYYVIPALNEGNELVDMFDSVFGMYVNDDCSLQVKETGKIVYNGAEYSNASDMFSTLETKGNLTDEELYKLWHDYNVWTLFNCYTPWLDTMQDCSYADSETITVMGEKFTVYNPLDPTSYFKLDSNNEIIEGRYMVFSRSEMAYYGLRESDLTAVERKIIEVQDNVYANAIDLMNYYNLSDETLIHTYSMMQLFEFNKVFSESSVVGEDHVMYPQGYELKAFTYDAYMRLILSEASGEDLMTTNSNSGIYERVMGNTSIFFGILLIINDIVAVYLVPILKLAFIVLLFFISVALIVSASVKLEFNIISVSWKSIFAPLLSYAGISIGMAFIVSLFMSNGAEGVTDSGTTISLGDPTMAVIVMLVINIVVLVLYWKVVKKCFKDFKTYVTAIFDNISANVVGALGKVAAVATAGKALQRQKGMSDSLASIASSAKQRGMDNAPTSGKSGIGIGKLLTGSILAGATSGAVDNMNEVKAPRGISKYDARALDKANLATDKAQSKADKLTHKADIAEARGSKNADKLRAKADKANANVTSKKDFANDIAKQGRFGAYKNKASKTASNVANKVQSGASKVASKGKAIGKSISSGDAGRRIGGALASAMTNTQAVGKDVAKGVTRTGKAIARGTKAVVDGTAIKAGAHKIKKGASNLAGKAYYGAYKASTSVAGGVRTVKNVVNKNISAGSGAYRNRRNAAVFV